MSDDDVVPLPESLKTCGCPRANVGMHLTSCIPAREHDAIPLKDRPEYVETDGRSNRFRGITWEFPLEISGSYDIQVKLDPEALLRRRLKDYTAWELPRGEGYAPWEKPIVYIQHLISEDYDGMGFSGGGHYVSSDWSAMGNLDVHPEWTPHQTELLHAALYPEVTWWSIRDNRGVLVDTWNHEPNDAEKAALTEAGGTWKPAVPEPDPNQITLLEEGTP